MEQKAFKLPIEYTQKKEIDKSIKNDLEFLSESNSLYHNIYEQEVHLCSFFLLRSYYGPAFFVWVLAWAPGPGSS